jgi:general secretion pathway protein G
MTPKRRLCGASKFEFSLIVALIGIFAAFLLNRLAYYEEQAEKAMMESTASTIKSALRIQMSKLMIAGRVQDYALLAQQNPLDWLEQKTGKDDDPNGNLIPDKSVLDAWSFDPVSRALIYSVKHGDYFVPDSAGLKRVRWKVRVITDAAVPNDESHGSQLVTGLSLELVEPYQWF